MFIIHRHLQLSCLIVLNLSIIVYAAGSNDFHSVIMLITVCYWLRMFENLDVTNLFSSMLYEIIDLFVPKKKKIKS